MNFTDIGKLRLQIFTDILGNSTLLKAIGNSQSNFLDFSTPDSMVLRYTQVYPYSVASTKFIDAKTYLTMTLTGFKPLNGSQQIKDGIIRFYIVCHQDLLRTDYGFRTDYILPLIDGLFAKRNGLGIGKVEFIGMDDLMGLPDKYFGTTIAYRVVDFT